MLRLEELAGIVVDQRDVGRAVLLITGGKVRSAVAVEVARSARKGESARRTEIWNLTCAPAPSLRECRVGRL